MVDWCTERGHAMRMDNTTNRNWHYWNHHPVTSSAVCAANDKPFRISR